jgi:hypothetical protein
MESKLTKKPNVLVRKPNVAGRKPNANRDVIRSRIFQMRMTEVDLIIIRQNAYSRGLSVSDYVRSRCLVLEDI